MPRYNVGWTKTGADSVRQLVEVLSSATVQRMKVFHLVVGNTGTESADVKFNYSMRRVTGSATGTAVTGNPLDPNDAAHRSAAKHLITADAASFNTGPIEIGGPWPVNNRATWQWMASDGRELVGAAVSANGVSLGLAAVSTSTFAGSVAFEE
jgi:hypothetical protein